MKKTFTLCIAFVMVLVMSVSVFAAPGNFIASPSGFDAPELIEFENLNNECQAILKITSYANRHTLDEATRAKLEKAYSDIVNSASLTDLNDDLADYAKSQNIDTSKLAASDLFDISAYSCDNHEGHSGYRITIKRTALKNFVGILHLNGDNWEMLEAEASGETITFTVQELSPFAIVVDTSSDSPVTGDYSRIGVYAAIFGVSAIALVVIGITIKKRKIN